MPPGDRALRHSSRDGPLKLSKMCSERSELYGRVSSPNATFSIPFDSYLKALSNTKDFIKLRLNPSEIWCQDTSVPPQRALALQSWIFVGLVFGTDGMYYTPLDSYYKGVSRTENPRALREKPKEISPKEPFLYPSSNGIVRNNGQFHDLRCTKRNHLGISL